MADVDDKTAPESEDATRLRDDEGRVNAPFVKAIVEAIKADDAAKLRELTEDLHEADIGALIETLGAEDRLHFVRLLTPGFDFKALTEVDSAVREALLRELPQPDGRRRPAPARHRRRRLHPRRPRRRSQSGHPRPPARAGTRGAATLP